jgi:hypothetical protein
MKFKANKYVLTLVFIISIASFLNFLFYVTFYEMEVPKTSGILNLGPSYLEWCINRYR